MKRRFKINRWIAVVPCLLLACMVATAAHAQWWTSTSSTSSSTTSSTTSSGWWSSTSSTSSSTTSSSSTSTSSTSSSTSSTSSSTSSSSSGSTSGTTIVPDSTWTCGMPGGIPDPSGGTLVFTTTLGTGTVQQVGQTPYGTRKITPITGGTLSGGTLGGSISNGAIDFDLYLPSGAIEHESRYTIKPSSSTVVYMRNCGVADGGNVRFVADFEAATTGSYSSLNSGTYVGTRKVTSNGIVMSVYKLSSATPNPGHTVVKTPSDSSLKQQAWNCTGPGASAAQGNSVTTARVNIGSSLSVGNSKYGRRNIIPITGGTVSGTGFSGTVNSGGADYQLSVDSGYQIEARYTLTAPNGEVIVVRNCGDFGTSDLTNVMFEAKTNGSYNWMNTGSFVGTLTTGIGRVTIGVYEKR